MAPPETRPEPPEFILMCADMLKLPRTTTATAFHYFHAYKRFYSDPKTMEEANGYPEMDDYLLATASLDLSSKSTDSPRKLRDILNVGYFILHPSSPYLEISDKYHTLRESLVNAELVLLRVLRFEMDVETPYRWIAACMNEIWMRLGEKEGRNWEHGYRGHSERDEQRGFNEERTGRTPTSAQQQHQRTPTSRNRSLSPSNSTSLSPTFTKLAEAAHFAWSLSGDVLLDPEMVLDRHPRDVAAACCYLGLKITGADEILEVLNRKGGNGGRGEGDEGFRNFCRHVANAKSTEGARTCVTKLLELLARAK